MTSKGYEILQFSLSDGWINNLYDGDNNPYVFTNLEEAITELQEDFDRWRTEIEVGERGIEEGYDIDTFLIKCNANDAICKLSLVNGKVEIRHD